MENRWTIVFPQKCHLEHANQYASREKVYYKVGCFENLEEVGDRTMVTLSRSYHGGLMPGVMAHQRIALADTTELTDTVYFVHSTGIRTLNPWVSKQQHCIFALL